MIKVCHMTSAHKPEDVRIFHKECCSLAKAGYDVYLVEQGDTYEKNGVHIIGIGEVIGGRWHRMTRVAKQVYEKALAIDADIYHLHDPELLQFALALKKLGKKVIFDSHENVVEQIKSKNYLPLHSAKLISKVYDMYQKHVLDKIDAVIFPCLEIDKQFPVNTVCQRKVTIDNFPMKGELYDKFDGNRKTDSRIACCVGTLTADRTIKEIVLATCAAKCKLILAGTLYPETFKLEVLNLPEANETEYLGLINRQEVLEVLKKSQVGIATIHNVAQYKKDDGNLPTKAHEYMSMALPIILTKKPYNEWFVEKYKVGICVDPTNIEEFAKAIKYLLDNPDVARKMGENGRRAVRDEYNWDTQAKKLMELYGELEAELSTKAAGMRATERRSE